MSIISGSAAISTTGSSGFYDFPIGQSLMFDGSSYLSRTFSSDANRTTMTFSFWSKQTKLGVSSQIFSSGGNVSDQIFFGNNDIFRIYLATAYRIETTQLFRDLAAWNHFVISIDTPNTNVKLYQNGVQIATGSIPLGSGNSPIVTKLNDNITHYIGRYAATNSEHYNGYLAEINFIDGTALTPASFGETKNGVWTPKDPSGLTYGTNGFRLTFENDGTTNTISGNDFVDQSTNSNNWTATGF